MQVLYHVRFWTSILRRGRRGPISIRAGDQRLDVATAPAFIQQAYGIRDDQMNLMELLDQEAPLIAEAEETALEVQTETEDLDGLDVSGEEQLLEDEFDEDSDNDES